MPLPRISLQALEAFERLAQSGSLQDVAGEMKLSISSVSHHIARLEDQLGLTLLDRSTRPFRLTREGQQALHHLSKGLFHLRRATSETEISGLLGTRSLTIGIVEDFESNVTPELAVVLARQMPRAKLSIRNILSHEAPALLQKGEIDVAVATKGEDHTSALTSHPLVRDPFVLAVPKGLDLEAKTLFSAQDGLPFLRFNKDHLIGKQVEAHFSRNRISLPDRFSFDSVQSIMAIIANGDGWSVMTPVGYVRGRSFADSVELHPLPIAAFARTIHVMSRADFDGQTMRAITGLLHQIVGRRTVEPACAAFPWLRDQCKMFDLDA